MLSDEETTSSDDADYDSSYTESDRGNTKKVSKHTFTDRIARDLFNSSDQVDKRLLKLHKFIANSSELEEKSIQRFHPHGQSKQPQPLSQKQFEVLYGRP